MKRVKLEAFLGKTVRLEFFDKTVFVGELHRANEKRFRKDLNFIAYPNHYVLLEPGHRTINNVRTALFRCSYVHKCLDLNTEE